MNKEYKFTGSPYGSCFVKINDDRISIRKTGFLSLVNNGYASTKEIRINQITGTQYKASGFAEGYLQFIIKGSAEVKSGGLQSVRNDENSIVWFGKKKNIYAEEIIDYINKFNEQKSQMNSKIVKQEDNYDKLLKLKKLLDDGIINQQEFETEKQKLLK